MAANKNTNPLLPMSAGCIAGGIEATAVWPMEYIKVRYFIFCRRAECRTSLLFGFLFMLFCSLDRVTLLEKDRNIAIFEAVAVLCIISLTPHPLTHFSMYPHKHHVAFRHNSNFNPKPRMPSCLIPAWFRVCGIRFKRLAFGVSTVVSRRLYWGVSPRRVSGLV